MNTIDKGIAPENALDKGMASTVSGILAVLNGVFLFGNGVFMLVLPLTWYEVIPGVTHTGPFNQHFVRDIGLIQMFLGALFVIGLRPGPIGGGWGAEGRGRGG